MGRQREGGREGGEEGIGEDGKGGKERIEGTGDEVRLCVCEGELREQEIKME